MTASAGGGAVDEDVEMLNALVTSARASEIKLLCLAIFAAYNIF